MPESNKKHWADRIPRVSISPRISASRPNLTPQPPASLSRDFSGSREVPTDPGLLRRPEYLHLPPAAFELGQDPEKWSQSSREIEQMKISPKPLTPREEARRAAEKDQSREPEPYDWQDDASAPGGRKKVPAAPYYIRREDPSTVLSQNAQLAAQRAQNTQKGPNVPLFGQSPQTYKSTSQDYKSRLSARDGERSEMIDNQLQKDFEAWDRGAPGSVGRFGNPVRNPLGTEKLYTKSELGGTDPKIADRVSADVGFDIASSKERTADVLRQSGRAEMMYDMAKERANRLKKPLFSDVTEQYNKNIINYYKSKLK